jgi:hypothetical protein
MINDKKVRHGDQSRRTCREKPGRDGLHGGLSQCSSAEAELKRSTIRIGRALERSIQLALDPH